MATAPFGLFTFQAPEKWSQQPQLVCVDETSETSAAPPPRILVTREVRRPHDELPAHALAKVFEHARAVSSFVLLGTEESEVNGQRAFRAVMRWWSEDGQVTGVVVWIDGGDGSALSLACAAIDQPGAFDTFDEMVASVRLGFRDAAAVPTAAPSRPSSPPPSSHEQPIDYGSGVPIPGARGVRR